LATHGANADQQHHPADDERFDGAVPAIGVDVQPLLDERHFGRLLVRK
jgi:hypothetical protein